MKVGGISLVLVLLAVPLAGCFGSSGELAPASDLPEAPRGPQTGEAPGMVGVTHRAFTGLGADAPTQALPESQIVAAAGVTGAFRPARFTSFEPTLGVDSQGRVFLAASQFAGPITIPSNLWPYTAIQRTDNDGATWSDVTPRLGAAGVGTAYPPQTNDPYVHIDSVTDRIFLVDLQAAVCSTLAYSDNGGVSWTATTAGCLSPPGAQDHQTVFTAVKRTTIPGESAYPTVVYYCVNRIADTACATSRDGGMTFGPLRPLVFQTQTAATFCTGGIMGHGVGAPDGRVYIARNSCDGVIVARSEDDGTLWTSRLAAREIISDHDIELAVDESGIVYALYRTNDGLLSLTYSLNRGGSWKTPIVITAPGIQTTRYHALAAGAQGKIAIGYYGSTRAGDPAGFPNTETWNAYIGITTDALAAVPVFTTVSANDPADPVARGACADQNRCGDCNGNVCNGNSVGDFLAMVIDGQGRPWYATVDMCIGDCATNPALSMNGGVGALATLASGPSLRGTGDLPPLRS